MTRINAGIVPKELHRLHLIAEYREITMVPAALRRSLRTKSIESILSSVPKEFTLNTGHVKFFYNKLSYLQNRFNLLTREMTDRGYKFDPSRLEAFSGFPEQFYNGWIENENSRRLLEERISMRKKEKPHLYR